MKKIAFILLVQLIILLFSRQKANAQFTSGPIPMCDTSEFTWFNPTPSIIGNNGTQINFIQINIISDHPGTLKILLASPSGISLVLSEFHGAGGQNYTGCVFVPAGAPNITTGTAPFTGNWLPEGAGGFSAFNGTSAQGTWTIKVIDTLCNPNLYPGGGSLTNGYFDGAAGGGGGFMIFPCSYIISPNFATICNGQSFYVPWYYNSCTNLLVDNSTNYSIYSQGNHSITYITSGGCSVSTYINLMVLPQPNLGPNDTINMCGNNYLNLDSVIGDTTLSNSWMFNWTPITNAVAQTVTQSGIYSVNATNIYGCTANKIITVNISPGLYLGTDQNITNCLGQTINLNGIYSTSGLTTNWYHNGQVVSNLNNISNPGTYSIVASNSAGCIDSANVIFSYYTGSNLGPDHNTSICTGSTIDLTIFVNGLGANIIWRKGGTIIPAPTSASVSGAYTAYATFQNGCKDTATINLTINQNNSLGNNINLTICDNESISLNSYFNPANNTINWLYNNATVSNTSSVSTAGIYTIIASDNNGCLDSAIINLQVNPSPNLGNDIALSGCFKGTLNLDSLFILSNYIYSWYLGTSLISNSTSITSNGIYDLYATNNFGCHDTAKADISIISSPSIGSDQNINLCDLSTTDLNTLFPSGANSVVWYLNGNILPSVSSTSNAGFYTIIETNNLGCTDTANVTVSIFSKPNLGNDLNINVCSNVTEDLTSYYNTTAYTVSWQFNGNSIPIPTNTNSTGNYILYIVDNNGCMDTASVNINQLSSPQLGSDLSETICSDSSINLNALINSTNLSGNWTYNTTVFTNTSNVTSPGTYNLIATNADGCSDTVNVNLTVNAIPNPGPSQTLSICQGQSLNLNSYFNLGNDTIVWSTNGQIIQDASAIQYSGSYNLQLTNSNGCIANSLATVTVLPKPEIGPSQTLAICTGTTIDLTNQLLLGGLTSSWEYNSNTIATPTNANQSGNYQVIAMNTYGCSDTAQINLNVNISPDLGPDLSYSLCSWQSLALSALVNVSGITTQYYFNGNAISNYNTVSDSGNYQIIAIDSIGCTDSLNVNYELIECICAADFRFNSTCLEDPIQFEVIADSAIVNTHWHFTNSPISESHEINPLIKLANANEVTVTLAVELSCGTDTISKTISFENCSEKCKLFIPQAFTPNDDGFNDTYQIVLNCEPEIYNLQILNRFGQEIFNSRDFKKQWNGIYGGISSADGIYIYKLEYKFPYQDKKISNGTILIVR